MILSFSNTVFKMQTIATIRVRIQFLRKIKSSLKQEYFATHLYYKQGGNRLDIWLEKSRLES